MIALTAAEIADITNGRLAAEPGITPASVVTDSREATAGSLYVAKPGENADGHDFVGAAFDRGAVLALVEREVADAAGTDYPAVVVEDAVLAMGALAAEAVRRIRASRAAAGAAFTVVGITGSAGKTTTKDLLAGIFAAAGAEGATVAPQGSYNGEVGVPLTVFKADFDTRYLVIEMGATGIGHIQYLADMVRPEIGVVLGVGSAHAGEFGGVENIAVAKGELVEALPAGGHRRAEPGRLPRRRDGRPDPGPRARLHLTRGRHRPGQQHPDRRGPSRCGEGRGCGTERRRPPGI